MLLKSIVMKKTASFTKPAAIICLLTLIIFQSCQKTVEPSATEEELATKKKPQNPPPTPGFTFNCGTYSYSGTFIAGVPANVTVTFSYSNSPGGSHNGYTSTPVNGITFSTPPGTLNVGSGSITYTASGTPVNAGQSMGIVGLTGFNSVGCGFVVIVLNAPGNCSTSIDPGAAEGSTGCVTFMYRGQQVSYTTVRAADGRVWLQQNLGSPQVAYSEYDQASYGDYFQWGRWDDGHQVRNSPVITGSSSLQNPSHISSGNPNFITGWWSIGFASDTWSGTNATSTNGNDPCAALGEGWRLPTVAEWNNVSIAEDLFGTIGAAMSNLKLPAAGHRSFPWNADIGYYWTSEAAANGNAKVFFFNSNYEAGVTLSHRGEGYTCRCIKD